MGTIFRYTLARLRGQVLGWGVALFVLGWPIVSVYDVVLQEQQKIQEIIRNLGPALTALFGNLDDLASPPTYLSMRYFTFMPLILGLFAVLGGSGLLAADEESGTLDLVLAHPVSRSALFAGRLLALLLALLIILTAAWLGLMLPMTRTALYDKVSWGAMLLPFLSLLAVLLFFAGLALLLSMLLPSRRLAATAAGLALVASFFVTMLARINPDLRPLARLLPLDYYQSGDAVRGLNGTWFGGLLAAAVVFCALAWYRFERRDIRVGGEGSWGWPLRRRKVVAG